MIKLQKYYETKQKEKAGGKLSERKWLKKKKKKYGKFYSSLCIIEKLLNQIKPQKLLM